MATKHGQPFRNYHMFDGKRYTYLAYEDTKREAGQRARSLRSLGYKVRVSREVSPLGKTFYPIWTRLGK